MATPLYSHLFYSAAGLTAGVWHVGTVPGGFVWVLRDFDAYANTDALERVDVLLRGAEDQGIFYASWGASDQFSKQWQGRQVIPPGYPVSLHVGGNSRVDVALSGYVLAIP